MGTQLSRGAKAKLEVLGRAVIHITSGSLDLVLPPCAKILQT